MNAILSGADDAKSAIEKPAEWNAADRKVPKPKE
jgi:hypothetical protein